MLLEKIDFGSIVWLLVSLFLLYIGYEDWKNREEQPTQITVADYVKSDKSKKWVVLTDAKINLLKAVTVTTTTYKKGDSLPVNKWLSGLYIPIESAGSTQNDTVSLLLETNDKEILDVASQLMAKSEVELLQFIVREKDKLIRSVELSGLTVRGDEGEKIRQHIKNLASNFYILKHNSAMSLTQGWGSMGAGLFMLTAFIFYLFSLHLKAKERKATKTAAAQARMQEIKAITEAYENRSKPETHAAYDSPGQVAKSPRLPSASIIIPPQRNDVVVEQNSVSLPNRDNSQVSPHRPPPNYYEILGISHAADLQKIKQAAQTKANEIKTAFTVLSHAETRTAYNANLSYAETRTAYDAKLNPGPHNHYDTLAVSREANLAQIEVATQARMNEVKESFENLSKPETRATYDSQWQPVKPSTPVAPSPPKRENVVVEPKPVSPPDRDKSQVSPHRLPPDYYKIFGISHSANLEEIKQAAKTKSSEIKTAFAVLSQADTRTTYDAKPNLGPHHHYAILLVKKLASTAEIKTAAQARMNEIKEAYENLSKLETRAAYDSQWQPVKPSTPVAPSPPKRENVVVEQKPVSPPDRDKSQVPPQRASSVSLTDETRHTTEIKLAKPGTCLIALIVDAFTLVVPIIFWSLFNSFPFQRLVSEEMADICVIVTKLIFIGVIMTNLVLFYHYGQTLGRRHFSIKMVDADGSRAGLCEFWAVKLLVIMLYFIIGVMMLILPYDLLTTGGRMPLVWFLFLIYIGVMTLILAIRLITMLISDIIRNPPCSHHKKTLAHTTKVSVFPIPYGSLAGVRWIDIIRNPPSPCSPLAHTIEVRVFPGKNDTPYGSLAGVIGTSTLMAVIFCLAAWGMIKAHTDYYTDYLKRSKVSKVSLERSKVSEVIEFLNVQKGSAAKSIAATGEFPLMGSILRLTSETSGKYLASVVSDPKGFYFEATMSKEDTVLGGKTVRLIYHPKSKTWSCSAAYPNGIPQEYLPSACK